MIAAGDIVPAKKPAPDIYTWAMRQLALTPEHCVALEDSENGVIAAREAGIRSILVTTNDYTADHDFNGAGLVLDQLGEPDAPFQVIRGEVGGKRYVDLALIRAFHNGS